MRYGLRRAAVRVLGASALLFCAACGRVPSPLAPQMKGSIGIPHRGVLTASAELPREGEGFRWLRHDDHHHGLPRFVHAIERAAAKVARERPGRPLAVGDLSAPHGGHLSPHLSHRTGRDADLLLYMTTLDGAPVDSPGWVHVRADGLAWDPKGGRFLRFDVEREWLLVKALLEDPEARVQWIFANHVVEAMLVEWARARGEDPELILRAMAVLLEPHPGGAHDDHVHVRTSCSPEEQIQGCVPTGTRRPWIVAAAAARIAAPEPVFDLVAAIARPLDSSEGEAIAGAAGDEPAAKAAVPSSRGDERASP